MKKIKCFCCYMGMENLHTGGFQPLRGVAFASAGHYGSTVFDPMDGTVLEIAICDVCLEERMELAKRWNGKKMSHGKKNLERPIKKARSALPKATPKRKRLA